MALMSVDRLTTSFYTRDGIVRAVQGISFTVERGETVAIVGESGSGKSVACYSLLQLVPQPPGKIESGAVFFDGTDLLQCTEQEIMKFRGNHISMIFQDPMTSLNPYMNIGEQLIEPLIYHQKISKADALIKAEAALKEVGIGEAKKRLKQYPHEFSGGMRQRVMIAMALMSEPALLIADEPTTALDVTIQAQIFELIKDIQVRRNLAVIFITHDLGVVAQIADRVLVMNNGKIVEQGNTKDIFNNSQHEYTRMLLDAIPTSAKPEQYRYGASSAKNAILQLVDVNASYIERPASLLHWQEKRFKVVRNVSLNLRKGEILGLVGESGCGKSTLAKTVLRLVTEDSGSIQLEGTELTILNAAEIKNLRKDFQIIFQDPYASLNPRMSVYDALLEPLKLHNIVPPIEYERTISQLMDEVGLLPRDIRKYPHEFSGGQRQRIAIARALAVKPKLIFADEPVSALDVTIQAQVLKLMLQLVEKYHLSMIFVSHDLSVIRYICDRTAVMFQGEIVEIGDTEKVFNLPQQEYTRKLLSAIPTPDPGYYNRP
jgi:oligopeptide transport system ATP-binding protein